MAKKRPVSKKKTSSKAGKKAGKKAAKKKTKKVEAVPKAYGTATPHLVVSPCKQALDFYEKAFGAKRTSAMEGPGGVIMHAEMKIGDSIIMLADEQPPMPGQPQTRKSPKSAGATTGGVMLYVKNVDAFFDRALSAGARVSMPVADMFWGDRYGQLEDPYGHVWAVATHVRDVSPKEMRQAMASMGPSQAA